MQYTVHVRTDVVDLGLDVDSVSDVEFAATVPAEDITVYVGDYPPRMSKCSLVTIIDWMDENGYVLKAHTFTTVRTNPRMLHKLVYCHV